MEAFVEADWDILVKDEYWVYYKMQYPTYMRLRWKNLERDRWNRLPDIKLHIIQWYHIEEWNSNLNWPLYFIIPNTD